MKLIIDYDDSIKSAILSPQEIEQRKWNLIKELLHDTVPDLRYFGESLGIPIDLFVSIRRPLAAYLAGRSIQLSISPAIAAFLTEADDHSYPKALAACPLNETDICLKLKDCGFKRELTSNQKHNLSKIGSLPAAATFSVPGAGKTTEALAYFFLNAQIDDKLLVVAPKNAFGAWDEQIEDCFGDDSLQFVRLRGGGEKIDRLLKSEPRFSIITYQQYPRVDTIISDFIRRNRKHIFVFLDESHRIKSGRSGVSAEAILQIASLPKRKLIMSGTPMPQSVKDLIPQFTFLYPDQPVTEENATDLFAPIYVRTRPSGS